MFSPLLDAFKSLDEVSDEIVAREKRIIKEGLEESDYKADEDALDVEFTPIENTFTASNIYEGLDGIDEEDKYLVIEIDTDSFVGNWEEANHTVNGDVIPSPKGYTEYAELGFVSDDEDAAHFTKEQAEEIAKTIEKAYGSKVKVVSTKINESLKEDKYYVVVWDGHSDEDEDLGEYNTLKEAEQAAKDAVELDGYAVAEVVYSNGQIMRHFGLGESLKEEQNLNEGKREIFEINFIENTDDCIPLQDEDIKDLCNKYNLTFIKSIDVIPFTFWVRGTLNNVERLCNTRNFNKYGIDQWDYASEDDIEDYELDESLKEEILDEKLPKDLAKAYRKTDKYRTGFTGDDRRQSLTDYEKAEYKEITPEEAIQARKDGRIQDLRILKDGALIVYRDDAYPLTGIEYVDSEDAFTNRNGKRIRDTRLMPLSHVVKIADKIYLTDERDHRFHMGKWVKGEDGESQYVYEDPIQLKRIQQATDLVPDTGKHKKVERDWHGNRRYSYGDPEYDEQTAKDYEKELATKQSELDALEAKWEAGDISKNEYENLKSSIQSWIDRYKGYIKDARNRAIRRRGERADAAAESRYALSRETLQQTMERYLKLKREIKDAKWDLEKAQERGGAYSWQLKGGSYQEKIKKIQELEAKIVSLQSELEKLQSEATDELKQSNLDQNNQVLADAQKKVDDLTAELDDLLGRAHKASGKEESLNEAIVNLKDLEEVEEVKKEREEQKEETPIEQVVDPNATIVNELKKSYVGDAILECRVCAEHQYIDKEDLHLEEDKTEDGKNIYNYDLECPICHKKEGYLLQGQVAPLPLDGKGEEEEEKSESEEEVKVEEPVIQPEDVEEVKSEEEEVFEENLTDFDEVSFDSHMTKYLTEVYSNVESYISTDASDTNEGIIIEGLIKFKSGKEKPTTFRLSLEGNKMNGLNETFDANNKIYTIEGKIENNTFITENIIYKYNIGDELVEGFTKVEE